MSEEKEMNEARGADAMLPAEPQSGELDRLLAQRSLDGGSLPLLAQRVQTEVECRERAKQWMKEHPDFIRRKLRQSRLPVARQAAVTESSQKLRGASLLRAFVLSVSASGSPELWSTAGSLLLGAACGYVLACQLAPNVHAAAFNAYGGLAVAAAMGCGLAAAAASQWRSIRSYLA